MSDKIIFLDIDGVLNSGRHRRRQGGRPIPFDPEAVKALSGIIEKTDARIVISSAWRYEFPPDEMEKILVSQGVIMPEGYVIDRTELGKPTEYTATVFGGAWFAEGTRGQQIARWLEGKTVNYAVIDDDRDAMDGPDHSRVFLTDEDEGLTLELAELIIQRLS